MNRNELHSIQVEKHAARDQLREEMGVALLDGVRDLSDLRTKLAKAEAEAADVDLMIAAFPKYERDRAWAGSYRSDSGRLKKVAAEKQRLEDERAAILADAEEELGAGVVGSAKVYRDEKHRFAKDYTKLINPTQDPATLVKRARRVIELGRSCRNLNDARDFITRFPATRKQLLQYV